VTDDSASHDLTLVPPIVASYRLDHRRRQIAFPQQLKNVRFIRFRVIEQGRGVVADAIRP
jgi:hypothetical protein